MADFDPQMKAGLLAIADAIGNRSNLDTTEIGTIVGALNETLAIAKTEVIHIGGQFLLDPNEINGWGEIGYTDDNNSRDLGNVGAANLHRMAGGLSFPYDVKIKKIYAWHYNNNNLAQAWGWVIARQSKTAGSNTVSTNYILDEVADNGGTGPRDYLSTQNQNTDIDLSGAANNIIPAGEIVILGVASPTAVTTNRYVRIQGGYIEFERV